MRPNPRSLNTPTSIDDFAPADVEAGTGLALQDEIGRYIFFLAGQRHRCPPGTLFYAGIGGHLEPGEGWLECVHREAREETGVDVVVYSSEYTWYLPQNGSPILVSVPDEPTPLALYEMIHPPNSPLAGEIYRIVIYRGKLCETPRNLPVDELRGVIALTEEQVIRAADEKPPLEQLLATGAALLIEAEPVDRQTRLYPIGTAAALGMIFALGFSNN